MPEREVFELQALEMIYLTALTGGSSFPGLGVDLNRETERGQRSLMDAQMKSLEAKGYLEIDFTGLAKVNEVLQRFITAAASCESYLCQLMQKDQETLKICYFIQDETRFELEQQPGSGAYRLLELYAQHELMFQVIDRIPLVEDLNDDLQLLNPVDEEPASEEWVEQLLHEGALMTSLAEIQCINEEGQASRELNLLIHEDQMWLLQPEAEEQTSRNKADMSTAIAELCLWLQEA